VSSYIPLLKCSREMYLTEIVAVTLSMEVLRSSVSLAPAILRSTCYRVFLPENHLFVSVGAITAIRHFTSVWKQCKVLSL
jgi:hypothetical protein